MSLARRRQLVDGEHQSLSIARQCALLGVSRSGLYYRPKGVTGEDLALMQAMDRQYLETPFYGVEAHESLVGASGVSSKPEAGATADAHHGATGHLSAASHQPGGAGSPGLPLPVGKCQSG